MEDAPFLFTTGITLQEETSFIFLIFFKKNFSLLLILSVMTKKTLEWKRALTNELDENRWSPLHFAAYVGCHPTIVRQLLEQFDRDVVYPRRQRPWKQDNSSYCSEPRPCGHSEAAGVALSRLLRES